MLPIPLFLFEGVLPTAVGELARERGMPPFEIRDVGLLLGTLAQSNRRFEGGPLNASVPSGTSPGVVR